MAKKTQEFLHESLQDKESIESYLKAIIQGFKKGEILLSDEEDNITLKPEALSKVKIKATQSQKSQSLSIKFSWSSSTDNSAEETPLFIDAKKAKK